MFMFFYVLPSGRSSECRPCLHEVCRVVTDEDEVNGRSSECRPCLHEVCRVVTDEDEVKGKYLIPGYEEKVYSTF